MKYGIFLKPEFGRTVCNKDIQCVDVPTERGEPVLWYSDECLNSVDYESENAIRAELANVVKASGVKYDESRLDNLVHAIRYFVNVAGYTPDKCYSIEIPDHDPCNKTAKIVLTEKIEKDGEACNKLTKIDPDKFISELNKSFDITAAYYKSLAPYDKDKLDISKVVLQEPTVENGNVKNRLVSIPIDDLLAKYKSSFKISEPYLKKLEEAKPTDVDKKVVMQRYNAKQDTYQLVTGHVDDFLKDAPFNPSHEYKDPIPLRDFDPKNDELIFQKEVNGENRLSSLSYEEFPFTPTKEYTVKIEDQPFDPAKDRLVFQKIGDKSNTLATLPLSEMSSPGDFSGVSYRVLDERHIPSKWFSWGGMKKKKPSSSDLRKDIGGKRVPGYSRDCLRNFTHSSLCWDEGRRTENEELSLKRTEGNKFISAKFELERPTTFEVRVFAPAFTPEQVTDQFFLYFWAGSKKQGRFFSFIRDINFLPAGKRHENEFSFLTSFPSGVSDFNVYKFYGNSYEKPYLAKNDMCPLIIHTSEIWGGDSFPAVYETKGFNIIFKEMGKEFYD